MQIDLGTFVTGLIILGICFLPFAIGYYNSKSKEQKMLNTLKETAFQQGCKIHSHEFCGDFVIGMDDAKNYVFFHKSNQVGPILRWINLRDYSTCDISKQSSNQQIDGKMISLIEQVDLRFTQKNKQDLLIFELFNFNVNSRLSGELQFAEKWSKIINERLYKKLAA